MVRGRKWFLGVSTLLSLAAVILLGACGGTKSYDSVEEISDELNCFEFETDTTAIFERESGNCSYGGDDINIYLYNNADARDQWLEIAETFGGVYVVGENWVVSAESRSVADEVQEDIGGSVR